MVLILCGKSGSGKDTIQKELVRRGFIPIVSTTSRPIRDGEKDGVDYNYTTRENFEQMIKDDKLVEYREYHTLVGGVPDVWYYGIEKQELDDRKDYVIVLDIGGTEGFAKYFGWFSCVVLYIDVPDDIREQRAMARGSFDKTEWDRRLADDNEVFSDLAMSSVVDCTIHNTGSIEECVETVVREYNGIIGELAADGYIMPHEVGVGHKVLTNGDMVRRMTDEELADRFKFHDCLDEDCKYRCPANETECTFKSCEEMFLKWLKQEVE